MSPPDPRVQMSAMSSVIDDLSARVAELAKSLESPETEHIAATIYEVERSLRTARRSLVRAERALG
ncbi:MAG TPA: hypothetical protein VHA73_03305 [Acidimicrobiales bacterium]|jgi:hypothetical protein|nr:hypothetical protein [Acidimicrobiales bacterium]